MGNGRGMQGTCGHYRSVRVPHAFAPPGRGSRRDEMPPPTSHARVGYPPHATAPRAYSEPVV
eukprot:scaffold354_cov116-Isochrysis_galbana.AAC.3